jgi:hypothetical protein
VCDTCAEICQTKRPGLCGRDPAIIPYKFPIMRVKICMDINDILVYEYTCTNEIMFRFSTVYNRKRSEEITENFENKHHIQFRQLHTKLQ